METIGPYLLDKELARGGMGVVYQGRHRDLERRVAIKVILQREAVTETARLRFKREAKAISRLRHPNVVRVHDVGEDAGRQYLVMELIRGPSLDRVLEQGPLVVERAVEVAHKLAGALEHAHQAGILHRDVKPGNVLLGRDGEPHLTDFGLAKDLSPDESLSISVRGRQMGTPGFWPPEQARGKLDAVDARSDVYALGATLYAMLTGVSPHGEIESMGAALAALDREPTAPSALRPEVPPALDALVLRCLAPAPEGRYVSAAAVGEALSRVLAREEERPHAGRLWSRALAGLGVFALLSALALWGISSTPSPSPSPARFEQKLRQASAAARVSRAGEWASIVAGLRREALASGVDLEGPLEAQGLALLEACRLEAREPEPYREEIEEAYRVLIEEGLGQPAHAARARFQLADYLRRRGRYRAALEQAGVLVDDPALRSVALALSGQLQITLGRLEAGRTSLLEAWLADPDGAPGLAALALRSLLARQSGQALRFAEAALERDPDHVPAQALRSFAGSNLDPPVGDAPRSWRRSDDPDCLLAAADGDTMIAAMLELTGGRDSRAPLTQASARMREGQFDEAVELLGRALEVGPDAQILTLRGLCLHQAQREGESLRDFRAAFEHDPRGALYCLRQNLGPGGPRQVLRAAGRSPREIWSNPVPFSPGLEGLQRLDRRAAGVAPAAREHLRRALHHAAGGSAPWDVIVGHIHLAHLAAPDDPRLALNLAFLYADRDRAVEALSELERARQLGRDQLGLKLLEAGVLQRLGNREQSRRLFEEVAASPDRFSAHCARAELALLEGSDAKAAGLAEDALRLEPGELLPQILLAEALLSIDNERAVRVAREALEGFGCLSARLLCALAAAEGKPFCTSQGLMQVFMDARKMSLFQEARSRAQAACWVSGGAQPPLDTAHGYLRPLAEIDPMLIRMPGAASGARVLLEEVYPLVEMAREREPKRAEVWLLAGTLASDEAERARSWAYAQELEPDLPRDPIHDQVAGFMDLLRSLR